MFSRKLEAPHTQSKDKLHFCLLVFAFSDAWRERDSRSSRIYFLSPGKVLMTTLRGTSYKTESHFHLGAHRGDAEPALCHLPTPVGRQVRCVRPSSQGSRFCSCAGSAADALTRPDLRAPEAAGRKGGSSRGCTPRRRRPFEVRGDQGKDRDALGAGDPETLRLLGIARPRVLPMKTLTLCGRCT